MDKVFLSGRIHLPINDTFRTVVALQIFCSTSLVSKALKNKNKIPKLSLQTLLYIRVQWVKSLLGCRPVSPWVFLRSFLFITIAHTYTWKHCWLPHLCYPVMAWAHDMLPPALFPGAEFNGLQNIISHSLKFLIVTMYCGHKWSQILLWPLHKNDMQAGKKKCQVSSK